VDVKVNRDEPKIAYCDGRDTNAQLSDSCSNS
jgi:hypothetical protein